MKQRGFASIAVIVFADDAGAVADLLGKYTEVTDGGKTGFQTGVMALPVKLTKGLEFDAVLLWKPGMEKAQKSEKEAKLRYVAVTRALHELYILN